jgi:hypothetical protein
VRLGAPILILRSGCSREGGGRLVAPRGDRIATDRPGGRGQGMVPYAVGLSTAARTCSESLSLSLASVVSTLFWKGMQVVSMAHEPEPRDSGEEQNSMRNSARRSMTASSASAAEPRRLVALLSAAYRWSGCFETDRRPWRRRGRRCGRAARASNHNALRSAWRADRDGGGEAQGTLAAQQAARRWSPPLSCLERAWAVAWWCGRSRPAGRNNHGGGQGGQRQDCFARGRAILSSRKRLHAGRRLSRHDAVHARAGCWLGAGWVLVGRRRPRGPPHPRRAQPFAQPRQSGPRHSLAQASLKPRSSLAVGIRALTIDKRCMLRHN